MRQAVHWLVAQVASRSSFYRTDRAVSPDDQFRSPVYIYIQWPCAEGSSPPHQAVLLSHGSRDEIARYKGE